jgi:hypothetical protein
MLRDTRTPPSESKLYPFSGFLRCADCGKAMGRRPTNEYVYYACKTYLTTHTCSRHTLRHDKLEAMVLAAMQTQIDLIDSLAEMIDNINKAPTTRVNSKRLDNALKQRRQELTKTKNLYEGLYMDWKSGNLSLETYQSLKQKLEGKEAVIKRDIAGLEQELHEMEHGVTSQNPYFDAFRKHRNLTELNRGIVAELIDVIYIHEDGSIDIVFAFADQHRRIIEFTQSHMATR